MEYMAVLSFDVAGAPRSAYATIYEALAAVGLHHTIEGETGRTVLLPTTTCAGLFTGSSAVAVSEYVEAQARAVFDQLGHRATVFVTVGTDWGWIHTDST